MVAGGLTDAPAARAPWLAFAAALALAGWLGWKAYGPEEPGDPLATSLVALEKQNRLTVFSAQLSPVVAADDERLLGMLKSRQIAVIPARIDYAVDFSKLERERLAWDEAAQRLTITLPPVEPGRPNLDEARAQYLREGVWITTAAQAQLTRANTRLAERQAAEQARSPVLLGLARDAARNAVRQNLTIPLQIAGYDRVSVEVRFDGEPTPP
ncbi:DUF4230 domain-containing protein [Novosphingobium sp.]|uniref:DUF4230 domain-containing protein n=1 Tax=Novosphingobium sp. TaxID=1874826 RepID=UPI0025EAF9F3|nr:DUF4230 domain-containing protein [Novosphingobium sp.]